MISNHPLLVKLPHLLLLMSFMLVITIEVIPETFLKVIGIFHH